MNKADIIKRFYLLNSLKMEISKEVDYLLEELGKIEGINVKELDLEKTSFSVLNSNLNSRFRSNEMKKENSEQEDQHVPPKGAYDEILPEVVRILQESPIPVRASVLRERLEDSISGVGRHKNFSSLMNELMKKDENIIRPSRGFYEYKSN